MKHAYHETAIFNQLTMTKKMHLTPHIIKQYKISTDDLMSLKERNNIKIIIDYSNLNSKTILILAIILYKLLVC